MIDKIKKVHFVGIKGVGMSGLAKIALEQGREVTGSDVADKFITDESLSEVGVKSIKLFSPENINKSIDLVIFSAAHGGSENEEVKSAKTLGIKTLSYARALPFLLAGKKIIAVAGTHGKTTTSAMLALILREAGLSPSWLIGTSSVPGLPASAHFDPKGDLAVVEADEYVDDPASLNPRAKFLYLSPFSAIITSTDWDHPDVFKTKYAFANQFKKLMKKVDPKGVIVAKGDDANLRRFAKGVKAKMKWVLMGKNWAGLKLQITGRHFEFDATCAARMAHELGVGQKIIQKSLASFVGSKRRLELVGEVRGVKVYDDYAHHPTEISETINSLKQKFPKANIFVIFQSHTYSRTKMLLGDFVRVLASIDNLAVAPIFASAREKENIFSDDEFFKAVKNKNAVAIKVDTSKQAIDFVAGAKEGDVVVTMGAGDIYHWAEPIIESLKK